jgi:hypothetical protein
MAALSFLPDYSRGVPVPDFVSGLLLRLAYFSPGELVHMIIMTEYLHDQVVHFVLLSEQRVGL